MQGNSLCNWEVIPFSMTVLHQGTAVQYNERVDMVNPTKGKECGVEPVGVIPGLAPIMDTFSSGKLTVVARLHGTTTKKTITSMHNHAILKFYIAYNFQVG
jgi:hypothetical protein